jgi:hypothetical protein
LEVSPELAQAIFNGEDPARAGLALNHLVNSIMNRVMQDAVGLMGVVSQNLRQEIPATVDVQYQGRSNTEKFFTKFPELNNPVFRPTVEAVAQNAVAVMTQKGQKIAYDDKFFDQVGQIAIEILERDTGMQIRKPAPVKSAPGQQPAQAAPKGRYFTQGGSRPPAGPEALNGKSADILSHLI